MWMSSHCRRGWDGTDKKEDERNLIIAETDESGRQEEEVCYERRETDTSDE
ncbi:MAG: hypothetical protein K2K09_05220 [Lachnospiraceae bacterium]|nr:hypothetical protein [Lachnospiraceae bacterium]